SLEALQTDLDDWLQYYNTQRGHSGRYCFGKTPMETWTDSKSLASEKRLDQLYAKVEV
ncbi:MAG: IS481 family transposase, partial [Bacteroidota bacterium]|nr:IS481 family transposase [Bacteroidota bacterium]